MSIDYLEMTELTFGQSIVDYFIDNDEKLRSMSGVVDYQSLKKILDNASSLCFDDDQVIINDTIYYLDSQYLIHNEKFKTILGANLRKARKIKRFEYIHEDDDYVPDALNFLLVAPPKLKALTIHRIFGLSVNFMQNITHLTVMEFSVNDVDEFRNLFPCKLRKLTIKNLITSDQGGSQESLTIANVLNQLPLEYIEVEESIFDDHLVLLKNFIPYTTRRQKTGE